MKSQTLKILVADDEPWVCGFMVDSLEHMHHKVDSSGNGSTAYHYARTGQYDLIFMDINMPVMNGIDSIKAIRERNKSVYIVLMSGGELPHNARFGAEEGANAFLSKPFTSEQMRAHITQVLLNKTAGNRRPEDHQSFFGIAIQSC